jgi:hypothetical protein
MTPHEQMTGIHLREWCARRDGEILFVITGPDAEAIARAAGDAVAYRDAERPTTANGYQLHGPWIDA